MKGVLYILQRSVTSATGTKSVRGGQEYRFVNRFQYHSQHFLHKFVCEGRDSKRSEFAVAFRNIRSSHRRWTVTAARQGFNDSIDFLFTESIGCIAIHTLGNCACIGVQVLVCEIIEFGSQHISEQTGKHFILIPSRVLSDVL